LNGFHALQYDWYFSKQVSLHVKKMQSEKTKEDFHPEIMGKYNKIKITIKEASVAKHKKS
jgi:pterin-4a-carbinolamine dehydratase